LGSKRLLISWSPVTHGGASAFRFQLIPIRRCRYDCGMANVLNRAWWCLPAGVAANLLTIGLFTAQAQSPALSPTELVAKLRQGGYVLVMRHASSPREVPTKEVANADNTKLERQLDEAGRRGAEAMGKALRDLHIPVGEVFTSPTYRALETVKLARLANAKPVAEIGDGGQSMQNVGEAQAAWLRAQAAKAPTSGNTIIVTHMPNIALAFPAWGSVADGETVVLHPDGKRSFDLAGRIKIEEWPQLR
jgi:phosphohistidine phosphatase SixA